jgi:hypothetical protein
MTKWIKKPLSYVASFFCSRPNVDTETGIEEFKDLPELVNSLSAFNTLIKTRIGILILYHENDLNSLHKFMQDVKKMDYLLDIIVIF